MATDDPVYLDHNATTPVLPEVVDAMLPYLREHFGNPSSSHVYGQRTRAAVERAREQVASLLGCAPEEVYFTSGGTESNNLAICGVAAASKEKKHLVTSEIEHPATEKPCTRMELDGWRTTRLGVDGTGRVDLAQAADVIDAGTALVTVMHANNEVGTIQPVAELAERVVATRPGRREHANAAAVDVVDATDAWLRQVPHVVAVGLVDGVWPRRPESVFPSAFRRAVVKGDSAAARRLAVPGRWTASRETDHLASAVDAATEQLICSRYRRDREGTEQERSQLLSTLSPQPLPASTAESLRAGTLPDSLAPANGGGSQ
jgi:hypothetical protein